MSPPEYVPDRGDIVWLEFTPHAGREEAGRRPALVLSPLTYNRKVGLAVFCPITSRIKGFPFEVQLPEGIDVTGVILCDHVRNLDWRFRNAKFITRVSAGVMEDVTAHVIALIGPND